MLEKLYKTCTVPYRLFRQGNTQTKFYHLTANIQAIIYIYICVCQLFVRYVRLKNQTKRDIVRNKKYWKLVIHLRSKPSPKGTI